MSGPRKMPEKLSGRMGFFHLFCLSAGAMISSGIFILPGLAYAHSGPAVILSYFLAGCLALIGILAVAELATAMPKAGGDYYFVTRSLGPLVGSVSGFLSWFALSLKTSFAVFGISEVVHLLTGLPLLAIAGPICLFFTVLNAVGVKEAARLEVILVGGLLGLMAVYFFQGAGAIETAHFSPLFPQGFNAALATAGFVFVSFGGLLNVATVAEEVQNPKRNIPLAFISSVVVITLFYTGILYVTVGVLPGEEMAGSLSPLADAARLLAGRGGYLVMTLAAMLAFLTTANAGIMAASRYPLALSRDRLLPPLLGRVSRRFGSPVPAVAVTGATVFLTQLLDLEFLVKAASTVVLTTYALAGLSVIVLRQSGVRNYQPSFRMPGYPWLPGLGILLFSLLIVDMGLATVEISLGLVAAGILAYFLYGRQRARQEYALRHLLERITSRDLTSYSLESELKDIVLERDQVTHDEFDLAVREAGILDLDCSCGREAILSRLAEELAGPLELSGEEARQKLEEREAQGSTALSGFVAVPHLVVPGKNIFRLLLARCRSGIRWAEDAPSVRAVIVIAGSTDRRNLHLKALAAVAHIVQHPEFEQQWLEVKHPEQLRDIFLLSERRRQP